MKFMYLAIILAAIPIASFAQDIVDTSSPRDLIAAPTIVVTPSTVEPDCHTYTGCDVMVVKRHYIYSYYKPKQLKQPKRHRVHRQPC